MNLIIDDINKLLNSFNIKSDIIYDYNKYGNTSLIKIEFEFPVDYESEKCLSDRIESILKKYYPNYSEFYSNSNDNIVSINFTPDPINDYLYIKSPEIYNHNIILKNKQHDHSIYGGMTNDQILSSPFVCISHMTYLKSLENIFKNKGLDHRLSLGLQGIEVKEGYGIYSDDKNIQTSAYNQTQYPGIYTNIFYQRSIYKRILETYSDGKYYIILPLNILKQKNYHINIEDSYGIINNSTFSAHEISKYINKLTMFYGISNENLYTDPELVIHDKIPIELFVGILVITEKDKI